MKDLSLQDLADLVVSDVPDVGVRLQKIFEWHYDRGMSIIKWLLGAAASIAVAVVAAFINGDLSAARWQTTLIIFLAFAPCALALYRLRQTRYIHRQFVAALRLHSELMRVAPFLKRYRDLFER